MLVLLRAQPIRTAAAGPSHASTPCLTAGPLVRPAGASDASGKGGSSGSWDVGRAGRRGPTGEDSRLAGSTGLLATSALGGTIAGTASAGVTIGAAKGPAMVGADAGGGGGGDTAAIVRTARPLMTTLIADSQAR